MTLLLDSRCHQSLKWKVNLNAKKECLGKKTKIIRILIIIILVYYPCNNTKYKNIIDVA